MLHLLECWALCTGLCDRQLGKVYIEQGLPSDAHADSCTDLMSNIALIISILHWLLQLGVVAAISAEKGPRGQTGVLLKKGTGPGTVCLQYPPNTPFRRVRANGNTITLRAGQHSAGLPCCRKWG
jgi:hypothetical protein